MEFDRYDGVSVLYVSNAAVEGFDGNEGRLQRRVVRWRDVL